MYKIKDKTRCSGCGACVNVCAAGAVKMVKDENGESYPYTDEKKCVSCGRCFSVCPYISGASGSKGKKQYVGYINDTEVRSLSSAGGIAAALSVCAVSSGGAVFGARYDGVFSCVHDCASDASAIAALSGRKYVESDTGMCFSRAKELLLSGKKVVFFGTPCQIAGLNKFLGAPFDSLLTVSVGCRGVVGELVWRKYIESVGVPESIYMTNRVDGENVCALALTYDEENTKYEVRRESVIHKAIESGLGLRPSCFSCIFRKKEFADLSLKRYDPFVKEKSVSRARQPMTLITVNTEKGREALKELEALVTLREISESEAENYLKRIYTKKGAYNSAENTNFMKTLSSDSIETAFEKSQNKSFLVKTREFVRNLIVK